MKIPHEINLQVDAQLDEELVHLPDVGGVTMRVQNGQRSHRVPDVDGRNLVAPPRGKPEDIDVLPVGKRVEEQQPGGAVRN